MKKLKIFIASLLTRISPNLNIKILYFYYFKEWLNLKKDPNKLDMLDKKLQWLKAVRYPFNLIYQQCADKYAVRKYVKDKGCSDILVELYCTYDSIEEIVWDDLPNQFALKWNFGAGGNFICDRKSKYDKNSILQQMKKWGNRKVHLPYAEMHYRDIPKKIICEKYLKPKSGKLPDDYKIYCFNGEPMYTMICHGRESGNPKFYFFDKNWNLARINKDSKNACDNFTLPKPSNYNLLLTYAARLSEPFDFVRADFYVLDSKIYFGELTFTPSGGLDGNRLPETNRLFGSLLKIKY